MCNFSLVFPVLEPLERELFYKLYKGPEKSYVTLDMIPVISVTNCMEQCVMNNECDGFKVTGTGSKQCVLFANVFPCETGDVMATDLYEVSGVN